MLSRWPGRRRFLSALRRAADQARDARRWREAAEFYEHYLDHRPDHIDIVIQAAHMRKEAGDLDRAEKHYLTARAGRPGDAALEVQLGHFYKVAGRPLEALAFYSRAVELDPDDEVARSESEAVGARLRVGSGGGGRETRADRAGAQAIERAIAALSKSDVLDSGLFDAAWYLRTYPDIARSGADALDHFVCYGRAEGRRPGPGFEPDWYLSSYPDVARMGVEPFGHYLVAGRELGLRPAGPPAYDRWVRRFDTLSDVDRAQIDAHAAARGLAAPNVVMAVDAGNEAFVSRAIRGLRGQRLRPASVLICLAGDVSSGCALAVAAATGGDAVFRVASAGDGDVDVAANGDDRALILLDAGVEPREHALYLLALAYANDAVMAYGDEDRIDAQGMRATPFFKPDASPLLAEQTDYVGGLALMPGDVGVAALATAVLDGATVADLTLTAFRERPYGSIAHVPHVLQHDHRPARTRRAVPAAVISERGDPLPPATIIVPTRDRVDLLAVCVDSLLDVTDYPLDRIDLVVVDNGSADPETLDYLAAGDGTRFRVIRDDQPFNYARLNNLAATTSRADLLVLLNNDTRIEDPAWLRRLAEYAMVPDVGAVGPKLLYDDGTIQHAGVVLGIGVAAAHAHLGIEHDEPGCYGFAQYTREVSAVTGACLAMRRAVFEEIGGLDEDLAVAFNDVDLCLTAQAAGYRNVYVHDVWLRHFESKSRGVDDTPAKVDKFIGEANYARRKHGQRFGADPYYNPNLSVMLETFYEPASPPRCSYPWRDAAAVSRRPRVLLLGNLRDPGSEIETEITFQAAHLVEAGYDVYVGAAGRLPAARHPLAHYVMLPDQRQAASFAVAQDIDCIVTHTSGYADVSRLLGRRPAVVLHHHGLRAERQATGGVGRDEQVAVRLALPAAGAVLASSDGAAAELEDTARIVPPGGDHDGGWTAASIAVRNEVRDRHRWADRFVVLVEGPDRGPGSREADGYLNVARLLDTTQIVLIDLSGTLGAPFGHAPDDVAFAGLCAAADMFWGAAGGSAGLAATAACFGLAAFTVDAADADAALRGAFAINTLADRIRSRPITARRGDGRSWASSLGEIERIVAGLSASAPAPRPARMLLAEAPLVDKSGLFDADAYLHFNPDVAGAGIDPLRHYREHGANEGRRPSFLFDTKWYLARYPEVAAAGLSPVAHYLSLPAGHYDPNPYFSNAAYLEALPEIVGTGVSPLVHYLQQGARRGITIGSGFDADFYARVHPDVVASGELPFVHFMRVGDAEGRLAVQPDLTPVDLFDDAALVAAIDRPLADIVPVAPATITSRRTAAGYVVSLLRSRPDLRDRFRDALSAGSAGSFAAWIRNEGGAELGLDGTERDHVVALLGADYAAPLRQAYLVRTDLRRPMPFALLPEGRGGLIAWAIDRGIPDDGFSLEELWWLLLGCAEDPERELWTTYAFTPSWQRAHPAGSTAFGADAFCAWLRSEFGLAGSYGATGGDPDVPPAEALRLAYLANDDWHTLDPTAFADGGSAGAFIDRLKSGAVALPPAAAEWLESRQTDRLADEVSTPGVNIIGHFCYPSGLKTSTEALVRGCRDVGLTVTERDIWVQQPGDEDRHTLFRGREIFDTTIMLCQPEPLFDTAYQRAGLAPRRRPPYRVGYWYWEQDEIPDLWIGKAREVDEVWTSTHFVGDALKKKLDVPVQVIPHGIELLPFERKPRAYFGLPDDQFLFLFTFHMMSVMERKNPLGLIEAFVREFRPDEKVGLVLKTSFGNHHPAQIEELRRAAAGANITIIDALYSKEEVLALMDSCDAYVSLHRSEGFGLTMAEAMLTGKPTIATNYSANLDFMTPDNSLLVDYDLVTLDRAYPPYVPGSRWAHASIPHASRCMRRLVDDPAAARALGQKGKADIEARLSFVASGRMIAARLDEIDRIRRDRREATGRS